MLGAFTATPMDSITAQLTTLTTLVGEVFTLITGNAYLCVFAAAALLGVGIRLFKKFKRAA